MPDDSSPRSPHVPVRSDDSSSSGSAAGEFSRDMQYITTRITADGADGYRAGPGRYRLVVARACPWANRAIIVRRLLGLEKALPTARRPGRRRPASRFPRATGRSPRRPDRE